MSAQPTLRELLRGLRAQRGWSQERMAAEAGLDHSFLSRLEGGTRRPGRAYLLRLVAGLQLGDHMRDRLLVAAGFLPENPLLLLEGDPELLRLWRLLHDPASPVDGLRRLWLRQCLRDLAHLAEATAVMGPPPTQATQATQPAQTT